MRLKFKVFFFQLDQINALGNPCQNFSLVEKVLLFPPCTNKYCFITLPQCKQIIMKQELFRVTVFCGHSVLQVCVCASNVPKVCLKTEGVVYFAA